MTEFLKQIKISDFGRVVTGGTPATSDSEMWGEGYPFVTPTEMDGRGMFPSAGRVVTEKAHSALRTRFCQADSIAVCCIGATIGKVVILPGTSLTNQQINSIVVDETQHDFRFVYYLMKTQTARLQAVASGSATPLLNKSVFESLSVSVPLLSDQRAIARVLGTLDDKIESNRRLIEVTEELGRHELGLALRGDDGTRWEYAWPESTLGEVLEVIESGGRPKGGVAGIEEGVPSIGAESIVRAGIFDYSKTKYVPTSFFENMNRGILQSGDVLLYKDGGTPGNFIPHVSMTQSDFPFAVAAINEHVYRLRIRQPFSQAYLYYWLSSRRMLDEMWLRGTGAAIPGLNSSNVKGLPIAVPPSERLVKILPVVDNLLLDLHQRAKESRVLANLRNTLIPELLSGRLRVKDAKSMMENV